MEVDKSDWESVAIDRIDRYLHRGGDFKGDEPQLLGGANLLNTIGVALGLPASDPDYWTNNQMKRARKGKLVYFKGAARKTIDVIAEQISDRCGGDHENYVTVLPIELYYKGKLYEVPLFRVHRYEDSQKYYVDNIGRYYDSFSDWFSSNKLPPCQMAYPYNLRLKKKPGHKYSRVSVKKTPSARDDAQIVDGVDTFFAVAGLASGVGLMVASGGLATPLVVAGASSTIWGTGRTTYKLLDRGMHGQSLNPITDAESRVLWLGVAETFFSLGAKGATKRLLMRGHEASTSSRKFVNFMNTSKIVISGFNKMEATKYVIENYDELSSLGILMHIASIAFWTKDVYDFKTADALIEMANREYS